MLAGLMPALLAMLIAFPAASDPLQRARPEEVGLEPARLARLMAALEEDVRLERLPGAVLAIARKGRLAWYESLGYRDQPARVPMPRDAVFAIASMTKPLTSVAALLLMEEGRLSLADPVAKHLPQLARLEIGSLRSGPDGKTIIWAVPATRAMTVHDLMRHTSGFSYREYERTPIDLLLPYGIPSLELSREEFLARMAAVPLRFEPGKAWNYSLSTDVLGLLIEAVAGRPLGAFLEERLFRPLAMRDTHFSLPDEKRARKAEPFARDPLTGEGQHVLHTLKRTIKFECGGTCAHSTAGDYLRFVEMLRRGGALGEVRVLSRKSVELMTADHLDDAIRAATRSALLPQGFGFGLGVAMRREDGVAAFPGSRGEYFWGGASGVFFWIDPKEELAVVLMTQAPGELRVHYRNLVKSLVMQAIVE
jgi:CubicO group peptidase (beta-lactamase class C family)